MLGMICTDLAFGMSMVICVLHNVTNDQDCLLGLQTAHMSVPVSRGKLHENV